MLKFFILRHPSFKHIENKELVYEALKWEITLPLLLSEIKVLIYVIAYYVPLILLEEKFKNLEIVFFLLAFVPGVIFYRRCRWMRNPLYPNKIERFLEENIRRYFVTPKGNALNKNDFKVIKKQNKSLYYEITSNYCKGICYLYARDIALLFPDSNLIYCAATNPTKQDEIFAHAILERNGEIYDTNRRMSYKIEDYQKIFKIDIFKKWTYEEFSKNNFQDEVREEFRRWCKEKNVTCYYLF